MNEYIKLHWKHDMENEPIIIFYEVCTDNDRLAKRTIDVFRDGKTTNIEDLYEGAIEITPIPHIEEINSGIWGEEFYACLVTQEEFENIWNKNVYVI